LDILDQLHTVSIEFTVMRDEGLPVGLEVGIQCLLAEQKCLKKAKMPSRDVDSGYHEVGIGA